MDQSAEEEKAGVEGAVRPLLSSCEAEYARIAMSKKDGGALDVTILRTQSFNGREILAWLASRGRLRYNDFVVHAEAFRDTVRRRQVPGIVPLLDPDWTIRLARVMGLQEIYPDDRINGLSLFRMVVDWHGPEVVSPKFAKEFCDLAIVLGEFHLANLWSQRLRLFRTARLLVQSDVYNPFARPAGESEAAWWARFCRIFERYEVAPPWLREGVKPGADPFDRLQGPVLDAVDDGPLVTVAISAFRPDHAALVTSVRSLLDQTWRNLDVIIVDDASPADFAQVFEECEALDDRVRVLRLASNGGTYVARNEALDAARGEFFTTQDADDWSHPLRIQAQVEALLADDALAGSKILGLRVTGGFLTARPASEAVQENASSLLFRLEQIKNRIGYFDSVRKGADTEYALRIERACGPVQVIPHPLSIIRISSASLSRSDFKPNWRHPARVAYRGGYEHWHELVEAGLDSPYRSKSVLERKFPAPRPFWVDRGAANEVAEYDFVFIGDWRQYGGPQKSMLEEIRALTACGFRVAVCHLEAYRFMSRQRKLLCPAVRELIHEGVVTELLRTDQALVHMAILRYPLILQYTPFSPLVWKIKWAWIVANQPPRHLDGSDLRYNISECIRNARSLFGMDPVWVPQGPQVREAIAPLLPRELLEPRDVPGIISVDVERAARDGPIGTIPVIGRYSRDNPIKFPADREVLLAAYPVDPKVKVRIMGGQKTCATLLGGSDWPKNWDMIEYDGEPVEEFLSNIDFFVNFDNDDNVEAFGRSMLEAMASGCVVILPAKFRALFGEGAVYANYSEVTALVKRLHADAEAYARLSRAGVEHVRRIFSHESYVDRMRNELIVGDCVSRENDC